MEKFQTWLVYLVTALVAWAAGLHSVYYALLILQGLDVALGVIIALRSHTFRSAIGYAGVQRRLATWALISAVGVMQYYAGILPAPPEAGEMGVTEWAALAMTAMEFASIVENAKRLGVPVPTWLTTAMEKVNGALGLTPREPNDGGK